MRANRSNYVMVCGLLLSGGVGWFAGHLAHRCAAPAPEQAALADLQPPGGPGGHGPLPAWVQPGWGLRSGLGAADLRQLPAGTRRKAEAALWLAEATAPEIAEWWPTLAAEQPQDWHLLDLVMERWVGLDPLGALATVANTTEEFRAWWAWGKLDPDAAVKEAKDRHSGHLWRVLQGAGAGDPLTAIRLMEEYPTFDYPAVRESIKNGLKNIHWRDSLDYQFDSSTLAGWSRYEPAQALRWALDHRSQVTSATWRQILDNLDDPSRGELTRKLAEMPTGKSKQDLETALVAWTAGNDPTEALRLANAAESPAARNRLLAVVGTELAANGTPGESLEMFRQLLAGDGAQADRSNRVVRPDGESWSGGEDLLGKWLRELVKAEPAKTLEALHAASGDDDASERNARMIDQASSLWLSNDFNGYVDRVRDLPSGARRDQEVVRVAAHLGGQARSGSDFATALEWSAAIGNPALRDSQVTTIIRNWQRVDQTAAATYFGDGGDATPATRALYQQVESPNR